MASGSKALVAYNSKILLFLRDNIPTIAYPDMWDLPGGAQEPNETLEETIKRELFEEAGIMVDQVFNLGTETTENGVGGRFLILLNENQYNSIKLGDEGQKYRFYTLDEALDTNLVPFLKRFIERNYEVLKDSIENGKEVNRDAITLQQL